MSWSCSMVGRAGFLSDRVQTDFEKVQGAREGAETNAKNKAGEIAKLIVSSLPGDTVVSITGSGSAWLENDVYKSHSFKLDITTLYNFVG